MKKEGEQRTHNAHFLQNVLGNVLSLIRTTRKKTPTIAWNVLGQPKWQGGIGLKHLHLLNQALLLKILCNLWTKPNSLLASV